MKAVLFDYNGTLIDDDDINEEAWLATIAELSQGKIDGRALYSEFTGMRNFPFVEVIFQKLGQTQGDTVLPCDQPSEKKRSSQTWS